MSPWPPNALCLDANVAGEDGLLNRLRPQPLVLGRTLAVFDVDVLDAERQLRVRPPGSRHLHRPWTHVGKPEQYQHCSPSRCAPSLTRRSSSMNWSKAAGSRSATR